MERTEEMTVKELYEWAVEHSADSLDIEIQYRDEGGSYYGVDDCVPYICPKQDEGHTDLVVLL